MNYPDMEYAEEDHFFEKLIENPWVQVAMFVPTFILVVCFIYKIYLLCTKNNEDPAQDTTDNYQIMVHIPERVEHTILLESNEPDESLENDDINSENKKNTVGYRRIMTLFRKNVKNTNRLSNKPNESPENGEDINSEDKKNTDGYCRITMPVSKKVKNTNLLEGNKPNESSENGEDINSENKKHTGDNCRIMMLVPKKVAHTNLLETNEPNEFPENGEIINSENKKESYIVRTMDIRHKTDGVLYKLCLCGEILLTMECLLKQWNLEQDLSKKFAEQMILNQNPY